MIFRITYIFAVLFLLSSCTKEADVPTPKNGGADFSSFVSLGDSYTAGYTNGALSRDGQESSFASMMGAQLMNLSLETYSIPLLPEGKSVGSSLEGEMQLKVTTGGIQPVTTTGNPELLTDPSTWINANGPYHNLGIPGARSYHLVAPEYGDPNQGVGNFNPYYARFASVPGVSTALSDALAVERTFFSLWIGGNDVLGYALAGGEAETSGMGSADITPVAAFTQSYAYMLSQLTASGAKGVVGTIPAIDKLPFFSVVMPNMLALSAEQAAAMDAAYADYDAAAQQYGFEEMDFSAGANFFVIEDEANPVGMRQIKAGEKILLTARTNITVAGWGSEVPIPDEYVLDENELQSIEEATNTFNSIIENSANQFDLAMVDLDVLMESTQEGLMIDGNIYSNAYITGGVFSLDGIHTTGRGSAIIANAFIEAVNEKYGSSVPYVLVNDQTGIVFP
ncbi:SGNH/GDSL hydrolase family protein [Marinilabilia rubra]|uniref:G-D-S-L family lipolytic protein n=1 Tax=Marinilabilia rubra TaxID=2162893 RepID=A0A2U2BC95_9BACT|nr:SGNH/GDSL hydrolase family protein [Marinilabilia rubra]PWE00657.1 hypothetical protein DDZ16_03410 [Marinilabilia rubra]